MGKYIQAAGLLLLLTAAWGHAAQTAAHIANQAETRATSPIASPQDAASTEPVTTLRVQTRIVEISAVVKDRDGTPRGGLTKDDFQLKQDGKEEPIHYFSLGSDLPLTIALLVDTSGSQRTFISDESLASDVFFESMLRRPDDRAMLVEFNTRVLLLKGLTSSADALHLALEGLSAHASTINGTLLNDAVFAVSKDSLAKETGRKAIVLLTDGGDNGSRKSLAEAIEQAQRADVQIYSILYSLRDGPGSLGPVQHTADPGMEILQKLSESTGGHIFTVSRASSLRSIFAAISQDLRLEYELGYTPPAETQPNTYHKLELKTKDRKLSVQARKGFFAKP